MDNTAIERIEALARAAEGAPKTDIPTVVLPGGCSIASLEEYENAPRRMRHVYKTERLSDFCAYVCDEAAEGQTAVFVESDGSGALAVIDYGSHTAPLWGDHKARLAMRHTIEFAALQKVCGGGLLSQRDLTDWLEDWHGIVTPIVNDEDIPVTRAVSAIRRVDISAKVSTNHEDGDFKASRSSMEEIEAKATNGNLPELFRLTCQVYPQTEPRQVEARLSLRTGADTPQFRLRIIGLDAMLETVAHEVEAEVRDQLGEKARVFIGSI